MKNSIILITIILLVSSASIAIPWPLSPFNQTHSLLNSYGDFHTPWVNAAAGINLHSGIDLMDPIPTSHYEPVYSVADGMVTMVESDAGGKGWFVIIEDGIQTDIPGNKWLYGHISSNTGGIPPVEEETWYAKGTHLGYIAHVYPGRSQDHLHLMRINETSNLGTMTFEGVLNPLFHLLPSTEHLGNFDWSWLCDPSMIYNPPQPSAFGFFVLPQYIALTEWGDPNTWLNGLEGCKAEAFSTTDNGLSGKIDLFLCFAVEGKATNGIETNRKVMPQRLEWWVEREQADGSWTNLMANNQPYHRYLFDFGDIALGGSDDVEKYKQLYFRYSSGDMNGDPLEGYPGHQLRRYPSYRR